MADTIGQRQDIFLYLKQFRKGRGNTIPVRNEGISPCNFSKNPLKNYRILKKKLMEIPAGINAHFTNEYFKR